LNWLRKSILPKPPFQHSLQLPLPNMNDIKDLEKTLWAAADKLRSNMDAAEYKHVVLGLIFLKYISDAFYAHHYKLLVGLDEFEGANPDDPDEYLAYNVFYVPETARWQYLQDKAKQPEIGKLIDDAMDAIEKINSSLKGVLPKIYADPELNKQRLGELIDLIGTIGFKQEGNQAKDLLGIVYEYFLGQFADAEGKKGGQFYTPPSIVKLLVEMLEPYNGRVYDGCCGSGGMFVQSEKFVKEHQGNIKNLSIYGQESNPTTLRLSKMNLAIRGIDAKIELGDTLLDDKHKDLKADFIIANPPFNISDWNGEQLRDDIRWKYGVPSLGNANYAWLQHFVHKLSPNGIAGIVLANGSMNSNSGNEGEIRKNMIEAGLIDCMVSLPSQLFYNTMIPACLWFLTKNKTANTPSLLERVGVRSRKDEILFIDARKLGTMVNRRNKELNDDDLKQISDTYHNWRKTDNNYEDIAGFCKVATIEEVRENAYVLMPGRYVGTEEEIEDTIPFADKMLTLTTLLAKQFAEGNLLEKTIRENLKTIGYEL
jgi:type I restriction enzyme M protein